MPQLSERELDAVVGGGCRTVCDEKGCRQVCDGDDQGEQKKKQKHCRQVCNEHGCREVCD